MKRKHLWYWISFVALSPLILGYMIGIEIKEFFKELFTKED